MFHGYHNLVVWRFICELMIIKWCNNNKRNNDFIHARSPIYISSDSEEKNSLDFDVSIHNISISSLMGSLCLMKVFRQFVWNYIFKFQTVFIFLCNNSSYSILFVCVVYYSIIYRVWKVTLSISTSGRKEKKMFSLKTTHLYIWFQYMNKVATTDDLFNCKWWSLKVSKHSQAKNKNSVPSVVMMASFSESKVLY